MQRTEIFSEVFLNRKGKLKGCLGRFKQPTKTSSLDSSKKQTAVVKERSFCMTKLLQVSLFQKEKLKVKDPNRYFFCFMLDAVLLRVPSPICSNSRLTNFLKHSVCKTKKQPAILFPNLLLITCIKGKLNTITLLSPLLRIPGCNYLFLHLVANHTRTPSLKKYYCFQWCRYSKPVQQNPLSNSKDT